MNYILNADKEGIDNVELFTKDKTPVSNGYNRIVIGNRGPYVEFTEDQLILKSFHIPKDQLYRLSDKRVYYTELRSIDESNVKLYFQLQTVAYADYKIGFFYISPYDLFFKTGECLATIKTLDFINKKGNAFFS